MAVEQPWGPVSFPAAVDMSGAALQRSFITINSSGQAATCATGVMPDGYLGNEPISGAQARVHPPGGWPKVQAGGTIARGALLAVGAAGLAVTAATTNVIIGRALEAGVSGQMIQIAFGYRGVAP